MPGLYLLAFTSALGIAATFESLVGGQLVLHAQLQSTSAPDLRAAAVAVTTTVASPPRGKIEPAGGAATSLTRWPVRAPSRLGR
jgi:hypothetical protein